MSGILAWSTTPHPQPEPAERAVNAVSCSRQLAQAAAAGPQRMCTYARACSDYGRSHWVMVDGLYSGLAAGKWPELAALDVSGNGISVGNGMSNLIRGLWLALTSMDMTDSWAESHTASCIDLTEADASVLASLSLGTVKKCSWPATCPSAAACCRALPNWILMMPF